MKYITSIADQEYAIEILGPNEVSVNGKTYHVDFQPISGQPVYSLIVDGGSFQAHIFEGDQDELEILLRGTLYTALVEDEREKRLKAAAGDSAASSSEFILKSPMPGLIVDVPVKEGDEIEKGAVLVILESMKMQNELKSPQKGTVTQVEASAGDSVEQKQTLVKVDPAKD